MEAFSLLKYWRGGGGGGGGGLPPTSHTTSLAAATDSDDDGAGGGDDGPFFDLEFTVPPDEVDDSEDGQENPNGNNSGDRICEEEEDDNIEECDGEFKFTLSPNSSNDRSDPNLSLSPSDDLFFKGKLVHVEPSPSSSSSEPNSKPQFTASLLKSATRFRAFKLGLKKPKPKPNTASSDSVPESQNQRKPPERKHFTVKFKVEEVPIMSLFTSSRVNKNNSQNQKQNPEDSPSSSKEVMNKYLKMVKPLYIRVSRRYGDKLGFSGQISVSSGVNAAPEKSQAEADCGTGVGGGENSRESNGKSEKQGNLPGGLRVVCKRLGKSRSASAAVAAAPPALLSSKRRDDSLLQQQDAIQGAILHCKRSFNASRSESECCESEMCSSSSSEVSSRKSTNEGKEKRV